MATQRVENKPGALVGRWETRTPLPPLPGRVASSKDLPPKYVCVDTDEPLVLVLPWRAELSLALVALAFLVLVAFGLSMLDCGYSYREKSTKGIQLAFD